ncbi:MAG: type II toxin-antitoxin system VapC family toxin [Propionibacteriaceae bacterium]|nr:type II toxin-antitoxin system VapC family toxin [Propionibacteriaceae bacterium]
MIVDTSAILAILKGEPNRIDLVKAILADPDPKISAATLVELFAVTDVRGQPNQSRRVDNLLRLLRISVVPFDQDQARIAREAYRDFGRGSGYQAKLNLGDCFSYALAAQLSEPLLYVGQDFSATDLDSGLT